MGKLMGYICFLLCVALFTSSVAAAQGKPRKLDEKKWKEINEDIRKRRYDKKESITWQEQERENRSYQDNSEANQWADGQERWQDPKRRSDYGDQDEKYSEYEDYRNSDEDIFDGNQGRGSSSEDDQGNGSYYNDSGDEWDSGTDDSHGGESSSGGSRSDGGRNQGDTYSRIPPKQDPPSRSHSSSYNGSVGMSPVLLYIILGLLLAAVLFVILRSIDWKNRKIKAKPVDTEDKFENLSFTKSELELAIEKALAEGNYREAVRIYFLAVVKELRDHGFIRWEKKKTNYAYLAEISGKPFQGKFEFATRVFEVVWYGNRNISLDDFKSVEPVYTGLLKEVTK